MPTTNSIDSSNKTTRHCIYCGEKLTKNEYYKGDDMCSTCSLKYKDRYDYTDEAGNNKIDIVLTNKFKGKRS